MAKLATTITFKESERHLYDFLKSRRSQSCFIKDLIEAYMNNSNLNNEVVTTPEAPAPTKQQETESTMNNKKRNVLNKIDVWDDEEE